MHIRLRVASPDPLNLMQVMLTQESSYRFLRKSRAAEPAVRRAFFCATRFAPSNAGTLAATYGINSEGLMGTITVNGKSHPYTDAMTVASLLAAVHAGAGMVVVEVNGDIVPRERYDETPLNAGDVVEIVHFVGGG